MKVRPWWFSLALLPLVGCETNLEAHLKDPGPAQLQPNWQLAQNKEEGVSLAYPPGWKFGVGTSAGIFATFSDAANQGSNGQPQQPASPQDQQVAKQFEDLANQERQEEADTLRSQHGIILQVVNNQELQFPWMQQTRVFVKKIDSSHNASLDEATQNEVKFLGGEAKPEQVTLPIGKAMRLTGVTQEPHNQTVHRISYVMVDGHNTYILRFLGAKSAAEVEAIEKPVAESLRIKPPK